MRKFASAAFVATMLAMAPAGLSMPAHAQQQAEEPQSAAHAALIEIVREETTLAQSMASLALYGEQLPEFPKRMARLWRETVERNADASAMSMAWALAIAADITEETAADVVAFYESEAGQAMQDAMDVQNALTPQEYDAALVEAEAEIGDLSPERLALLTALAEQTINFDHVDNQLRVLGALIKPITGNREAAIYVDMVRSYFEQANRDAAVPLIHAMFGDLSDEHLQTWLDWLGTPHGQAYATAATEGQLAIFEDVLDRIIPDYLAQAR
jgi:hypothetical protein